MGRKFIEIECKNITLENFMGTNRCRYYLMMKNQ